MTRILFVDDELEVLNGLKRMLRGKRNEWNLAFANSGREALELLERNSFDVIVSDSSMPSMDGAELFRHVRESNPDMVRIILSGVADQKQIMRLVKSAHQFLAKPIDREGLLGALNRALAMRRVIEDPALVELISGLDSLPALPQVYAELLDAIEAQKSLEAIGGIIETDVGMSANILKMVNSAFFGIPQPIHKPAQAARLLGLELIESLVLSYQLFQAFDTSRLRGFSFEGLWAHCAGTAKFAKVLAKDLELDKTAQDKAFITGMLHDVGKLILATQINREYEKILNRVRKGEALLWEAELDALGTTHAETGAYLMGLWGMSNEVVLAMAYHHRPEILQLEQPGLPTVVYAADNLEHELVVINEQYNRPPLNSAYLESLGLADRVPRWKLLCGAMINTGKEG